MIGTALFAEGRDYGDDVLGETTGTVNVRLEQDDEIVEDAVELSGGLYLPNRRHLRPQVLIEGLQEAGLKTIWHSESGGGMALICQRID